MSREEVELLRTESGFLEVYNEFKHPIHILIGGIVMNDSDAPDVEQNVWCNAWKGRNGFNGDAKISTWLYRIAKNEALDYLRKKTVRDKTIATNLEAFLNYEDLFYASDVTPEKIVINKELTKSKEYAELLNRAFSKLPHFYKNVLTNMYLDDNTLAGVSTTPGALKFHRTMARKALLVEIANDTRGRELFQWSQYAERGSKSEAVRVLPILFDNAVSNGYFS